MKVAAVQLGLHPRKTNKALDEAESEVKAAARGGSDLVCLPEHWLLGYILEGRSPVLSRFAGLAKDLGIHLNLGANYERRRSKVYLSSHTFSRKGEVLPLQDKLHLYGREKLRASPGRRLNVIVVDGHKVGVLVCHDLVFPEPARTLVLMGAELLVVPALIVAEGFLPWLTYLRARALENRVPIVSPNCYAPPRFPGNSAIIALNYQRSSRIMQLRENLARPGSRVITADFDLGALARPRQERLDELKNSRSVDSLYEASRQRE
jgi:predicted amidohydrolase